MLDRLLPSSVLSGFLLHPLLKQGQMLVRNSEVNMGFSIGGSIEGRLYGHTVLQLPSDPAVAEKLRRWLSDEGVIFTEEE